MKYGLSELASLVLLVFILIGLVEIKESMVKQKEQTQPKKVSVYEKQRVHSDIGSLLKSHQSKQPSGK